MQWVRIGRHPDLERRLDAARYGGCDCVTLQPNNTAKLESDIEPWYILNPLTSISPEAVPLLVAPDRERSAHYAITQIAQAHWPTRVAAWLLFTAAALAPLPFGSSQPIAIAFWCIVLGIGLVLAPIRSLSAGQLVPAIAGVVVAAYALMLHEQLAEHPWLPGAIPHPIWHDAEVALKVPLVPSVSIAHNQPLFELGRPLVCVLAISCGFLVGADAERARQLLKVIAWSGAAYAAYGILAHLFDPTHILWREKEAYLESVTGTFINRNTAGAYFGSCAVVWSLLFWERARLEMPPGPLVWRAMFARLFSKPPKKVVIAFAMLFLCLVAMFMSLSGGAAVLALFVLILPGAARPRSFCCS